MGYKLLIAQRVNALIEARCRAYPDVETGGVLLGTKLRVLFDVSDGPRAHRSREAFRPSAAWQQRYVDYLFERFGVDYLGDWHKHPSHVPTPSATDLATARTIVTSERWNTPQAVFPIATMDRGVVSLRAFRITRENQRFEEIPIVIVPDSDPRLIAVLTGTSTSKEEEHDAPRCGSGRRPSRALLERIARRLRHSPSR